MIIVTKIYERCRSLLKETIWKCEGVSVRLGKNRVAHVLIRHDKSFCCDIGDGLAARRNVILNISNGGTIRLGKNVFINDNVSINSQEKIYIGDNVIIGQGVMMFDHDHDYKSFNFRSEFKKAPITIGTGCWIGAGAIILKGSNIGNNCVIAAGTIVNRDIPDNTMFINKINPEMISYYRV